METITIIRPKQIRTHEPPGQTLPVGNYVKLVSRDNPESLVLVSRTGLVFEVDEREISEAVRRGYVK